MLTVKTLQDQLPKVGDVRTEIPTVDHTAGHYIAKKPKTGVVVYVNRENLWYTVQFENGSRESYKLPCLKPEGGGAHV